MPKSYSFQDTCGIRLMRLGKDSIILKDWSHEKIIVKIVQKQYTQNFASKIVIFFSSSFKKD